MQTLFRLTHHKVFRIQLQVFKLLFSFAKSTSNLKFELTVVSDEKEEGEDGSVGGTTTKNFKDRFYRTLYELQLRAN